MAVGETRQRLRSSSSSSSLIVNRIRLSAIDDQAFPIAAARVWYSLSHNVISAVLVHPPCSDVAKNLSRRCTGSRSLKGRNSMPKA